MWPGLSTKLLDGLADYGSDLGDSRIDGGPAGHPVAGSASATLPILFYYEHDDRATGRFELATRLWLLESRLSTDPLAGGCFAAGCCGADARYALIW